MLVIVVIHRLHSWLVLMVVSYLCKQAWCLGVVNVSHTQDWAFRSVPAQGLVDSVSKVHGVFSNRNLPSTHVGQLTTVATVWLYIFKEIIIIP